jgi:AraC-like DNA-binding protein
MTCHSSERQSGFAPRMPTRAMELVSAEEFLRSPEERYTIGSRWLCFCASTGLSGAVLWGRLVRDDVAELLRAVASTRPPSSAPHPALLDARRVESVDPGAFGAVAGHVEAERDALGRAVTRLTIIRPEGFAGVVAAGFFRVVAAPCEVDIVESVGAAQACLRDVAPPALFDELDALQGSACATDPFLYELVVFLKAHARAVTLADAASKFRLSTRTFQRNLAALGTSFQSELDRVRVDAAKGMILADDMALGAIAREVGCASPSHLSVLFRRVTGEVPSAWRARARVDGVELRRIAV